METGTKNKIIFLLVASLLLFTLFINTEEVRAQENCEFSGWSWSSNTGWISFSGSNYGVVMDPYSGVLSGYAWSSNLGWLSFDDYAGCPVSPCEPRLTGNFPYCDNGSDCNFYFEGFSRFLAGDPPAGGWRGWVRLSDSLYGLRTAGTSNHVWEVSDWAWGGGDGVKKGVHGWSSANCLEQGSCGNSDYKVILSCEGINFPPQITSTAVLQGSYCEVYSPPVFLTWEYLDPDGDEQGARHVKVYSGGALVNESCSGGFDNCQSSSTTYAPPGLDWDTSYTWEVKIWDERGAESEWVDGEPFTTGSGSIFPDFTWEPTEPVMGEQIQFFDQSFAVGNIEVASWFWQFEAGVPATSEEQNPIVQFETASEGNEVSLTVSCPEDEVVCTETKEIEILLELPEWIEVPPGG